MCRVVLPGDPFDACRVYSDLHFIPETGMLYFPFFFFVSLAKHLLILLVFSNKPALGLLIFSTVFLVSILLISALMSVLLLGLG